MSSDGNERNGNGIGNRRKLRVLVITMGGSRKKQIEDLFSDKSMSSTFESPTFSDGVLSRSLRNRYHFFRIANEAGLLPEQEWIAIQNAYEQNNILNEQNKRKDYNDQDRDLDLDRDDCTVTIVPFPCLEHLEEDLSVMMDGELDNCATTTTTTTTREKNDVGRIEEEEEEKDEKSDTKNNETNHIHNKPGGNLCWGAYAYWMSNEGYESLMGTLRNDVGAILWKGKRQRHYSVKPIDKILPRQTIANFGSSSVQISSQPAFFRAPMLTSKIHSKWDPGFCDATEYQLQSNNLDWYNLSLTDTEREIVSHHNISGKWITEMELQSSSNVDIDASASANNTAI
ncbi:hypothetical protein FRACYDRAFT_240296 [Fragilariopsis cylindrus CCMP1102]|uniref:Uncharacterized protein n=1 Tax=Fragilariopsis cylindrus CCMP1102 TaxID=635003 RepID=A0A1E7FCR9_9STRA|nr:hypothetical protein FRACYDRAFT_240296 [Fragilariopsis cylindrus CCMP1102]|eukprot:OEU15603.1 hypothetical protein FRACYDRAFT_240296 [Fragilariopsis cylindrus CCMP1102]